MSTTIYMMGSTTKTDELDFSLGVFTTLELAKAGAEELAASTIENTSPITWEKVPHWEQYVWRGVDTFPNALTESGYVTGYFYIRKTQLNTLWGREQPEEPDEQR